MVNWNQIREKILSYKTPIDLTERLYSKIASCGCPKELIIKPSFYFGLAFEQMVDFVKITERILKLNPSQTDALLRYIFYLRESCTNIYFSVRQLDRSLDNLVDSLDELYFTETACLMDELINAKEEAEENDENDDTVKKALRQNLAVNTKLLFTNLKNKLLEFNLSENTSHQNARLITNIYLECILYYNSMKQLLVSLDKDITGILKSLVNIQDGLQWKQRALLHDELYAFEEVHFNVSVMTWSSHLIRELIEIDKIKQKLTGQSIIIPGAYHYTFLSDFSSDI